MCDCSFVFEFLIPPAGDARLLHFSRIETVPSYSRLQYLSRVAAGARIGRTRARAPPAVLIVLIEAVVTPSTLPCLLAYPYFPQPQTSITGRVNARTTLVCVTGRLGG